MLTGEGSLVDMHPATVQNVVEVPLTAGHVVDKVQRTKRAYYLILLSNQQHLCSTECRSLTYMKGHLRLRYWLCLWWLRYIPQ